MKINNRIHSEIRASRPAITLIAGLSVIPLGIIGVLHFCLGISSDMLTRDPVSLGYLPLYAGFLSQTGIFLWAAAAAVCLFSAMTLPDPKIYRTLKQFLYFSAAISLTLGLDDTFQLHEEFFPRIGIHQLVVLGFYVVSLLLYLLKFYPLILNTEWPLLLLALFFFSISVALDITHLPHIDPYLFEDGAKLIGEVSWMVYFFRVGGQALRRAASPQAD